MVEINLQDYFYQVWKRKNIALSFLASVLLLTILFTLKQTKVYRAVTTIEIGAESADSFLVQDIVSNSSYNGWWSAMRYYETQYQIMQSRDLLSKVAERAIRENIFPGGRVEQVTAMIHGGIAVKGDEDSRIASIYFDDSNAVRAQQLSIMIAEVYVDENLGKKLRGIDDAAKWLNERLKEVREEKSKRENELQKKRQEFKVVSLSDHESIAKSNLKALTENLNRLRSTRIEVQARYGKLKDLVEKSQKVTDLFGVVSSEVLTKLKNELTELQTQRSKLAQRYLEKHPELIRVDMQISEAEKFIKQEVGNEVSRLNTKFLLAKAEEDSLAAALEQQKMEAIKIEQVNRDIADVELMTNTNQQIFETLLKKIKEADLSSLVKSNNVRVIDKALVPGGPIKPNLNKNILLALVIGLIGGAGIALLLEYIDDTVKSHEDIERYLNYSVLALIPHMETEAEKNGMPQESVDAELAFLPAKQPSAVVSEFYRTLRTNILFLSKGKKGATTLFASTGPGEGKTITALNLSVTLAQIGKKTIILDLDFRRPKLHRVFANVPGKGITNVLLGELSLEEAIQKSDYENLDYMVAGAIPPNPAELLSSVDLRDLLEKLSSQYDHVILDSSPIAPVTDAAIIAQYVHGVILIVRSGKTHRKAVMFANQQLKKVSGNVLGVVLNDVRMSESSYGSYQYYRYGYSAYTNPDEKLKKTGSGPVNPGNQASL